MNKETNVLYILNDPDGCSAYDMNVTSTNNNDWRAEIRYNDDIMAGIVTSSHLGSDLAPLWKLHDHGNGVSFKSRSGRKIKIEYDELHELYLLLRFYYNESGFNPNTNDNVVVFRKGS